MNITDQCESSVGPADKHLATDHLLINLERRAFSSGMITFFSQGAQFVLNLGSIVVLARLLSPGDFGLVAMLTTVMGFLRVFREAGLSTATIQREGITHAQVSNLFWINVSASSAIGVLLAAISPLIAWFYREPRLVPVTLFLAVTFPLSGLAVQHTALLSRQMRFKALAFVQVGSQSLGVATGITMAWLGRGYWALVGMNLVTLAATVTFTFIAVSWRPQAPARGSGTRPLFNFGANLAAGGFVYSLAKGADSLAIGRIYGSEAIGLYSRAGALFSRPLEQVLGSIDSVFVPMLSRVQSEPDRYRSIFLRCFQSIALLSSGFFVLLALARPVTLLVLGKKWEQAAVILAGFCLSGAWTPLTTGANWLLVSQGRGKDLLRVTLIVSAGVVLSVLIGIPFGPAGVAIASSLVGGVLVGMPTMFYLAGQQGPVTTRDLWLVFLRCIPLWAAVAGVTFAMYLFLASSAPIVQLVVCAPMGLTAGALVIWISPPLRQTALGLMNIRRELLSRDRPVK